MKVFLSNEIEDKLHSLWNNQELIIFNAGLTQDSQEAHDLIQSIERKIGFCRGDEDFMTIAWIKSIKEKYLAKHKS